MMKAQLISESLFWLLTEMPEEPVLLILSWEIGAFASSIDCLWKNDFDNLFLEVWEFVNFQLVSRCYSSSPRMARLWNCQRGMVWEEGRTKPWWCPLSISRHGQETRSPVFTFNNLLKILSFQFLQMSVNFFTPPTSSSNWLYILFWIVKTCFCA